MVGMQNVVVGYIHGDHITQEFHHCLFRAFVRDLWGERRILNFAPQYSGCQLSTARNQMVRDMLDQADAEWLWMLDSDATFSGDMLYRLLAHDEPIVGALAHRIRGTKPIVEESPERDIVPVVYKQERDENGNWVGYRELETYGRGLIEADATGCHCLLVHRDVFEKVDTGHPHRWFHESVLSNGALAGEDITFCLAARDAGFRVMIDTSIEAGHVKPFVMTSKGAR